MSSSLSISMCQCMPVGGFYSLQQSFFCVDMIYVDDGKAISNIVNIVDGSHCPIVGRFLCPGCNG